MSTICKQCCPAAVAPAVDDDDIAAAVVVLAEASLRMPVEGAVVRT